jgi:23S rRNA pseudouridine955/2504/2580 synthase
MTSSTWQPRFAPALRRPERRMAREVRTLEVAPGEAGVRLDRWLKRRWPQLSHVQIHKLARSGQIRVDGGRVRADTRLTAGAQVRVPPLPETPASDDRGVSERDAAFARSLVLYEDDEVLALNKPSGLAVQGGTKTSRHVDRLLSVWGEGVERPRLVHRLDRDTSGVLVLGKGPVAAAWLAQAFAQRRAAKTYWAIVAGRPRPPNGNVDVPLVKSGDGEREQMAPAAEGDTRGAPAETDYVTLMHTGERAAWLALRPHTGRTHQLRAHMKAVGHPILGDRKYGDERSAALSVGLKLQLHARRLELPHPGGGRIAIEAPLSPEMRAGFERFGFDEATADPEPFSPR